jgi:flagellar biosynthesis/type III secretory pathway protein FliH
MKVKLIPSQLRSDLTFEVFRNIQKKHRVTLAQQQALARKRRLRYARWARAQGHAKGYEAGAVQARQDIEHVLHSLQECYQDTLRLATDDTQRLAQTLATRVVERLSNEDIRYIEKWITQGLSFLRSSRPITLYYHPRFDGIIQELSDICTRQISIVPDSQLEDKDFHLTDGIGGVEFNWRSIINESKDTASRNSGEMCER